jgi:diguanylate cyclase (GGDEF)-like protein
VLDLNRQNAFVKALLRALEFQPGSGRDGWLGALLAAVCEGVGAGCVYLGVTTPGGWTRFVGLADHGVRTENRRLSGLARRMAASGGSVLEPVLRRGSLFRAACDGVTEFRAAGYAAVGVGVPAPSRAWLVSVRRPEDPLFDAETLRTLGLAAVGAATALRNEARWKELEELAMTDGLTQIPNYRFLRQAVDAQIGSALRRDEFFTVVMVDVDNLKAYNACHGHLGGSEILRDLARLLRENVRRSDLVGKYGGDEFLIVLPRTRPSGGVVLAERVRRRIGERLRGRSGEFLSCSFGVAGFPEHGFDFESLIRAADRALFYAKVGGRNAVVNLADTSPGEDDVVVDGEAA